MDAKIFHFKCGAEGEGETEGLDSVMRNGVAGPKKLGGIHVTLQNEYENSYGINFVPTQQLFFEIFICSI